MADASSVRLIRGAGIDPLAYARRNATKQPPLVVLPARLLRGKGVEEFVAASRLLKQRGVKARFALVAQPDHMNPTSVTQEDIDHWVAERRVEARGWRDDMPAVLSEAQIVCLPSYHEGLLKSLLEAAASGCPMVATDIPGCREVVRNRETGLLVPARDSVTLADALHIVIDTPALRPAYGAAARRLVEDEFSRERVIKKTFDIYAELRSSRSASPLPT